MPRQNDPKRNKLIQKRIGSGGVFLQSSSKNLLLLLLFTFCVFFVMIGPIRNYFREQANLNILQEQLERAQDEQDYYRNEAVRWSDDKFIIAYAREHYAMIMPGELAMHVIDPNTAGTDKDLFDFNSQKRQQLDAQLAQSLRELKMPWYERIRNSFTDSHQDE
jgi:cell division protein FtsB